MGAGLGQLQAVQKPAQLPRINLHDLFRRRRPMKRMLLQPFQPDAKAVIGPVKDFYKITIPVAESEKASGEKIQFELAFNQKRQPINRFPHIGGAKGNIYFSLWLFENHS